jgi:hypothetical protein
MGQTPKALRAKGVEKEEEEEEIRNALFRNKFLKR